MATFDWPWFDWQLLIGHGLIDLDEFVKMAQRVAVFKSVLKESQLLLLLDAIGY